MEFSHGEQRFEASHDARREFYLQVEKFMLAEIQENPEMRQEFEDYLGYAQLMQRIVSARYPQREELVDYIHHAVDALAMPSLPVTLPPPHKRFTFGEHMVVSMGYSAGHCWPDRRRRVLTLLDDTDMVPQTSLGKIDIVRNLPQLEDKDGAVIKFARHLLRSTTNSLIELAQDTESRNSRLSEVDVYGGVSHLARIAGKLHFTVFSIADERDKREATAISKRVATSVVGGVSVWKEMEAYYKPAEVAFISRENLIEHFGSHAISHGFTAPQES